MCGDFRRKTVKHRHSFLNHPIFGVPPSPSKLWRANAESQLRAIIDISPGNQKTSNQKVGWMEKHKTTDRTSYTVPSGVGIYWWLSKQFNEATSGKALLLQNFSRACARIVWFGPLLIPINTHAQNHQRVGLTAGLAQPSMVWHSFMS